MTTYETRLVLKGWVKMTLTFVAGVIFTLTVSAIATDLRERSDRWFEECDSYYGYTTDYYTCRQYHIRGGE